MSVYMRFGPLRAEELGNSTHNITKCPGGVQWMLKYLGACARNPQEEASQYLGILSMILWMLVGLPQIIKNFRNLDGMAGVSFFLLFQWAGGDITNLVGSILTHQLPFQIYLAIYFVFIDAILLVQYIAYCKTRVRNSGSYADRNGKGSTGSRVVLCLMGAFLCSRMLLPSGGLSAHEPRSGGHLSRALLSIPGDDEAPKPLMFQSESNHVTFLDNTDGDAASGGDHRLLGADSTSFWHDKTELIGYAIGILSSIFYLGSRIAQIVKNAKKQSTEGLAFLMFFLAVLGNLAYGLQILVHSVEKEFLLEKTPWLVGSLGVIGLDCTLLGQFHYYKNKPGNLDDMRQSLINNEITVNGGVPSATGPELTPATDVEHAGNGRPVVIY